MHKVLVLGAGKIGTLISGLLGESGSYEVHLGDVNESAATTVVAAHGLPRLHAHQVDAADSAALDRHLTAHPVDAVISSLPFYCNVAVA
jgi:saccharopine dehydrogenase-like NADP-dependent oxidoreductase